MTGSRLNRKNSVASKYGFATERAAKKENYCKIYGHTAGKVRTGSSVICAVCCKRYGHSA